MTTPTATSQRSRYGLRARSDFAAVLVLLLLPFWVLGSVVIGKQALVPAEQLSHFPGWSAGAAQPPPWDVLYWDDLAQLLPWQKEAQRSVRAGRAPLWNHGSGCGSPLLANSQTSGLSPSWLLFQGISLVLGQGWMALLQLWLAGIGTYAFLRFYDVRSLPALLGAVVYQLSGWSLCWLEFPNRHAPVAWFPVCLWLLARSFDGNLYWRAAAAVALSVSVLSSHIQFEFYLFLGLALFSLCEMAREWRTKNRDACSPAPMPDVASDQTTPPLPTLTKGGPGGVSGSQQVAHIGGTPALLDTARPFLIFLTVAALAVLLAAPQLLPSIELGRWSHRAGMNAATWAHYSGGYHFWMPVWWLAQAFVPGFFGYPHQGTTPTYLVPGPPPILHFSAEFYEFCVFVGIVPLLLMLRGLRQLGRSRLAPFLAVLGTTAILLAAGTILNAVFYFGIPGFSAMAGSARMLYLFAFAAAGLAAVGLDSLDGSAESLFAFLKKLLIDSGGLVALGVCLCCAAAFILNASPGAVTTPDWVSTLTERGAGSIGSLILLIAAVVTLGVMKAQPRTRPRGEAFLLILSVGQLLAFAGNVVQTAAPSQVFPQTPVIKAMQDLRPFRTMQVAKGWPAGPKGRFSRGVDGYPAPLPPNTILYYDGLRSLESYDSLQTQAYNEYVTRLQGDSPAPPENGNLILLSNPASPMVAAAGVDLVVSAIPIKDGHLRSRGQVGDVYFYGAPGAKPRAFVEPLDAQGAPGKTPTVAGWNAGEIKINDVQGPGRLVILDSFVPGWTARIDGAAAPVQTYDGLFKSVKVGPGLHRAVLSYRPLSFRFGVFLSAAAAAIMACVLGGLNGARPRAQIIRA